MALRARSYRGGVPCQAHDGHLRTGAAQERARLSGGRSRRAGEGRVEATVDATQVYTGQPQRDAHLRSADFFDVEHHPTWTFVGSRIHQVSGTEFEVTGDLTVRGVTRPVTFDVTYLGQWNTRLGGRRGGTTGPGGAPVSPPRRVSIGMTSV
ncbi:YceI family protein [Streptomyces sp. NPDC048550]|uniref:YceI family protein n=1 Tax=Streptomyces sp. NPDC048550 TaxID=3155739 RepID=UPI00341339D9